MQTFANTVLPWTYMFKKDKQQDGGDDSVQDGGARQGGGLTGLVFGIVGIVLGIYAGYLCWKCNTVANTDMGLKVIYTAISFVFAIPYLIYYWAIRVIIGAPCTA